MLYINQVHNIFPIKVCSIHDEEFSYKEEFIEMMQKFSLKHESKIVSNVGGYQSISNFHTFDEEFNFTPFIEKVWSQICEGISVLETENFRDRLKIGDEIKLLNTWFNINTIDAYNAPHTHPGCLLSGVLWLRVPENCGDIYFVHPREFETYYTSDRIYQIKPKEGTMILFPSYFCHGVYKNENESERISLAFNLDFANKHV